MYQAVATGGGAVGGALISSWQVGQTVETDMWMWVCVVSFSDRSMGNGSFSIPNHNRRRASPSSRSSATTCPRCKYLTQPTRAIAHPQRNTSHQPTVHLHPSSPPKLHQPTQTQQAVAGGQGRRAGAANARGAGRGAHGGGAGVSHCAGGGAGARGGDRHGDGAAAAVVTVLGGGLRWWWAMSY